MYVNEFRRCQKCILFAFSWRIIVDWLPVSQQSMLWHQNYIVLSKSMTRGTLSCQQSTSSCQKCQKVHHDVKQYVKKYVKLSKSTPWRQNVWKVHHGVKKFVITSNICQKVHYYVKYIYIKKCVMMSISASWRQQVCHDVKNFMKSKSVSLRQQVCRDVKNFGMVPKTYHDVKSVLWCQKVCHNVKKCVKMSWCQKVRQQILSWCQKHVIYIKKFIMASKSVS